MSWFLGLFRRGKAVYRLEIFEISKPVFTRTVRRNTKINFNYGLGLNRLCTTNTSWCETESEIEIKLGYASANGN
jgi:hypothetical protein